MNAESSNNLYKMLDEIIEADTEGLLDEEEKPQPITATARLEQAFIEICEFYRDYGRGPSSETRDVRERKLGARLDGFRSDDAKAEAVAHLDEFDLLSLPDAPTDINEAIDSDDLDLLYSDDPGIFDLSSLPKVKRNPDDVAVRMKAEDFENFEHLFKNKHTELAAGEAIIVPFGGLSTIKPGRFFILGGIMLFVARIGDVEYKHVGGENRRKQRLRVIFENGIESAMYKTSLAIRMGEKNGRAIIPASHLIETPKLDDNDVATGHIYVLKSLSKDPEIKGLKKTCTKSASPPARLHNVSQTRNTTPPF
ncbi:hypothetical protein [Canibacter zhuwentaonis]|uniref:hypothetical protein n=1 Tax=Canibacter zhuwentaonis TaxID=2837491 RepID=UPI002028D276|nr:hypothetical protein [Canibacter zhuwentaonis]